MKSTTKKLAILGLSAVILTSAAIGMYNPLSVDTFTIRSEKITTPLRIAHLSDLHSCRYGEGQRKLVEALEAAQPDLICLTGDIFDDRLPDGNTELLLAAIADRWPCYYVTGNHEYYAEEADFQVKMDILEKYGVRWLRNESTQVEIKGQRLTIYGADDPRSYAYEKEADFPAAVTALAEELRSEDFNLLLSHRPEHFSLYADCGFDLALCGHAHGGQWQLPWLLPNGIIAPHQGLFPRYTNGAYTNGAFTMIVSRGLSKEKTIVPRLYNRPQIVLIDLQ